MTTIKKSIMHHAIIVKSPESSEFIIGPMFSLTVDQSKNIINYFKSISKWNLRSKPGSLSLVPPAILFDTLKIFPMEFKEKGYLYNFNIHSMANFFDSSELNPNQTVQALNCYSQNSGQLINTKLLGGYTTENLLSIAQTNGLEHRDKIPLTEQMVNFIQGNKHIKAFYQLNLRDYNYFIEDVSLQNYLIVDNKDLFISKLTYLPLSFIDR